MALRIRVVINRLLHAIDAIAQHALAFIIHDAQRQARIEIFSRLQFIAAVGHKQIWPRREIVAVEQMSAFLKQGGQLQIIIEIHIAINLVAHCAVSMLAKCLKGLKIRAANQMETVLRQYSYMPRISVSVTL